MSFPPNLNNVLIKFVGKWKKLTTKGKNRMDKMYCCGCLKMQYNEEETHHAYCVHTGFQ
jgi:hypothetical protein